MESDFGYAEFARFCEGEAGRGLGSEMYLELCRARAILMGWPMDYRYWDLLLPKVRLIYREAMCATAEPWPEGEETLVR